MQNIAIDQLMNKTGSIYKLVILASRRALELSEDETRLGVSSTGAKPVNMALKEIMEGKISYKVKERK